MAEVEESSTFFWIGNRLALDMVNTEAVVDGCAVDLIAGFTDLVRWLETAGVLTGEQAVGVRDGWVGTARADEALVLARVFRGRLRRIATALAAGDEVPQPALDAINDVLREQRGYSEVRPGEGGFEKRFHADFAEPVHLLVPVAESMGDLLCYGERAYVRKCSNPHCVLYFYDTTKNHARRWCSMSQCGNRAKAAAHYERKRTARR